jgi:hypothetical protein
MSKAVDEILNSIIEEFKAGKQAKEELEAKSLFRLLNYCPPSVRPRHGGLPRPPAAEPVPTHHVACFSYRKP